jgi:ABC-type dipeptide/oligopeptide/nickel transport system permease subunit
MWQDRREEKPFPMEIAMIELLRALTILLRIGIPLFAVYMGFFHSDHIARHTFLLMYAFPLIILTILLGAVVRQHDANNSTDKPT